MNQQKSQAAVAALLSEYERAIRELQKLLGTISPSELTTVVDTETTNPDCKSIQTIMAHVVRSGYSYAVYVKELKNIEGSRPERINKNSISEYQEDLERVIKYNIETFHTIYDDELEESDSAKKIMTAWNQLYDIEQLMEHAIVHILRHRRQIENFLKKLR